MSSRLRRLLTARPVDLPIYRRYVLDHPKHAATALVYMLPWSVTLSFLTLVVIAFCVGGSR